MCSSPLRELSNPGASGSIFYLTEDDEFIIKTVQHKEGEFLQTLLPGYYMNLNQNPRTLLPKFFGLYCYRCNSKNVRLIAMNNLLPSAVKLHQKYDLKGSTYKRKVIFIYINYFDIIVFKINRKIYSFHRHREVKDQKNLQLIKI